MIPTDDTIVAISSCARPALRAILRLSGDRSQNLLRNVFTESPDHPLSRLGPYSCAEGHLALANARTRIPATAYVFRAPESYTRQDVLELHFPGSLPLAQMLLDEVLAAGARLARPGEFTRRAFENGRIDLTRARAVLDLITARTHADARRAVRQITGALTRAVKRFSDALLDLLARVELSIDFSEDDVPVIPESDILERSRRIASGIHAVLTDARDRQVLRGDVRAALVGRPNVGKSTLFNAILSHDRAIVHPRAGTTRDAVEAQLPVEGIPFLFIDLAGKLQTDSPLDVRAWEMALRMTASADVNLLVFDSSVGFLPDDHDIYTRLESAPTVIVANKTDLCPSLDAPAVPPGLPAPVAVSAKTGQGVDDLKSALAEFVRQGRSAPGDPPFLLSTEERDRLRRAADACTRVTEGIRTRHMTTDVIALELRDALDALGEITGSALAESLLDRIFEQFCIGK